MQQRQQTYPGPSRALQSEQVCLNQIKRLTQALFISGTLNILMLAFILYGLFGNGLLLVRDVFAVRQMQRSEVPLIPKRSLGEALVSFQTLSFDQLVAKIEEPIPTHQGYNERDLALSYLAWRHHFNVEKALGGSLPPVSRILPISCSGQQSEMELYAPLSEAQYSAVVSYAKAEKWPLTSQGLFHFLKGIDDEKAKASLAESFFLTPEFLALQRAVSQCDLIVDKNALLTALTEGSWTKLTAILAKLQEKPSSAECAKLLSRHLKIKPQALATAAPIQKTPPVAKAKAVLSTPQTTPVVYVIKSGDSLWKIAQNHKVDVAKLRTFNALKSDVLHPGHSLRIPS